MIPEDIRKKIEDEAISYYKSASIGNKFKQMHELGFNRGAEFGYNLASELLKEKEDEIKRLKKDGFDETFKTCEEIQSLTEQLKEKDKEIERLDSCGYNDRSIRTRLENELHHHKERIKELEDGLREIIRLDGTGGFCKNIAKQLLNQKL